MSSLSVSVVIPVYNGEPWISEAIHSVLNQTYPIEQILVVDDASTDQSAALAERLGVTVIRLPVNGGEGKARNTGIQNARANCIAMLDADDYWHPRHIEVLVSLLERYPEASIACAATKRFGLRSELIKGYVLPGKPRFVFWKAYDDWLHTTIGALFKREALLAIGGFSEQERYSVDYDLWLRLSRLYLFVSTHEVTSYWRWHQNQQSQSFFKQLLSVYHFRFCFYQRCVLAGDYRLSRKAASRSIQLWRRDCATYLPTLTLDQRVCLLRIVPLLRPTTPSEAFAVLMTIARLLLVGANIIYQGGKG